METHLWGKKSSRACQFHWNHSLAYTKWLEVFAHYIVQICPLIKVESGKSLSRILIEGTSVKYVFKTVQDWLWPGSELEGDNLNWTASNSRMYVKFEVIIIVKCFNQYKYAKIQIPSDAKLQKHPSNVKSQYPDFGGAICTMDGVNIPISVCLKHWNSEDILFPGSQHYVTHAFVFAADGTIPICCLNLPGSTHVSTVMDLSTTRVSKCTKNMVLNTLLIQSFDAKNSLAWKIENKCKMIYIHVGMAEIKERPQRL